MFGGNPTTYGYPADPVNMYDLDGNFGFAIPIAIAVIKICVKLCGKAVKAASKIGKRGSKRAAKKAGVKLTASQVRSLRSLERQVAEHRRKLAAYRANPDASDNLGHLRRAATPEIRRSIINGRIRHLQNEIRAFENQIEKLRRGGR